MDQRIPKAIRPALKHYLSLLNEQLPDLIKAFYIEGSIALGGFNEHFSDVDFMAILDRHPSSTDIKKLRNIHKIIEQNYPRWRMSGSYLPSDNFKPYKMDVKPNIYFHDGLLKLDGHFELNSVEGWILKNHGIMLLGDEPQDLPFIVDWDLLIVKMRENLNSYWVNWTKRPFKIIIMLFDSGIQWTVLGVLRQFYSFRENSITTKIKAGEYGLAKLPFRWHRLIKEAIEIREGNKTSAYRFRIVRTIEAVRFVKFIIQTCNADVG